MARRLTLHCIRTGADTRFVDAGRRGLRHLGVAAGGPADPRAADAGNRLLDQPRGHPCLEFGQTGGRWLIGGRGQMVLTGADMDWRLNGQLLEPYTVLDLDGDYLLTGGFARRGNRAYLTVRGNWELPRRHGSVEPGVPGIDPIVRGTEVSVEGGAPVAFRTELSIHRHLPTLPLSVELRPGPEFGWLSPGQMALLLERRWTVGRSSNRQGLRLTCTPAFDYGTLPALISSPVLPGTVQLTPGGLILLGPDAQTVGGYPRILLVAGKLGSVFQLKVGDGVRLRFWTA